jgi:hypothetical protein
MPWLRKLTRTGDSWQVIIPADVARVWNRRGVAAVLIELEGTTLRLTPQLLRAHEYVDAPIPTEDLPHADRSPKP